MIPQRFQLGFWLQLVFSVGIASFSQPVGLIAHDAPHKHPEAEAHKPTPLPDRINLCVTQTPAKSVAVTWRTDLSVNQGLVEVATAQSGPIFIRTPRQLKALKEDLKSDLSEARYHSVVIDQLEPETVYAYRVGDEKRYFNC
jgi:hypothetical protein